MAVYELRISEELLAGTQSSDSTDVIGSDQVANVYIYEASCPDSALAYSKIKYGNEVLWVIQRDSKMPIKLRVKGDGVNSLELICANECSEDYHFNAYAKVSIEDG